MCLGSVQILCYFLWVTWAASDFSVCIGCPGASPPWTLRDDCILQVPKNTFNSITFLSIVLKKKAKLEINLTIRKVLWFLWLWEGLDLWYGTSFFCWISWLACPGGFPLRTGVTFVWWRKLEWGVSEWWPTFVWNIPLQQQPAKKIDKVFAYSWSQFSNY